MKTVTLAGCLSVLVLLAGCATSSVPTTLPETRTAAPLEEPSVTLITISSIVPSPAVTEGSPIRPGIDCGWNWATREDPELQAQVDAAMSAANLTGVAVRVSIFGEDCLDQSGQVVTFATMETDFDVEFEVADLEDREAIGNRLAEVFAVLAQFDPESTPGPQAGRILVTLQSKGETKILSVGVVAALEAVQQELRGAALMEFLEGPTF